MISNIGIRKASSGPVEEIVGLSVPGACLAEELEIYERAYRDAPAGAGQVTFVTDELDPDGEPTGSGEIWDEVEDTRGPAAKAAAKRTTQAQRWRRIMGWRPTLGRDPTPADADAFLRSVNAEASTLAWYALKAYWDKAASPPVSPASPAATSLPDDPDPPPRPRQPPPGGYRMA